MSNDTRRSPNETSKELQVAYLNREREREREIQVYLNGEILAPEADKHHHTLPLLYSTSDQHGGIKSKEREPVSTLDRPRGVVDA